MVVRKRTGELCRSWRGRDRDGLLLRGVLLEVVAASTNAACLEVTLFALGLRFIVVEG